MNLPLPSVLLVCLSLSVAAQTTPEPVEPGPGGPDPLQAPIGPHHVRIVTREGGLTPAGLPTWHTNEFVLLEVGLNYPGPTQEWLPAQERFVAENGWAVAREGNHRVAIYHNLNAEGGVVLDAPDGRRLRSHILGLVYYDPTSGQAVLIGEVQESQGVFLSESSLLFPEAFSGASADVRYTYTKSGLAQDIILRERLVPASAFGLSDASRLEVWTEFVEGDDPQREPSLLNAEAVAAGSAAPLVDEELDFGAMRIGLGRAFPLSRESDQLSFVAKSWNVSPEGRRWLIETVEVAELAEGLEDLPPPEGGGAQVRRPAGTRQTLLAQIPAKRPPEASAFVRAWPQLGPEVVAAQRSRPGLVVDYTILNAGYTNLTFKGNETYYVNGLVTLSGTTTFEGGAIIKYTNSANARIELSGTTVWPATTGPTNSPYRPIIFTYQSDNSVGQAIPSPTNNPSTYYADVALKWGNATSAIDAHNLRFVRAKTGIALNNGSNHKFRHIQFVDCESGIRPTSTDFGLHNALFTGVTYVFNGSSATGRVEHATVNGATALNYNNTFGSGNLRMTNSLVVAVTTLGSLTATNKVAFLSSASGVFASVAGGAHYLASGSPYRDLGVNVSANLSSDLPQLTTYPPTLITSPITSATVLSPANSRDTNTLDLGYHYAPIDFLFSSAGQGVIVTNASLTLRDGVVVAHDNPTAFILTGTSSLSSVGLPHRLNVLTYHTTVQERKSASHTNSTKYAFYSYGAYNAGTRSTTLAFTAFEGAGVPSYLCLYWDDGFVTHTVSYRDCQMAFMRADLGSSGGQSYTISLINNLWLQPTYNSFGPFHHFIANQTVRGGSFSIYGDGLDWRDSLLHSANVYLYALSGGVTNRNNLFVSLTSFSSTGTNISCLTNSSFTFATGRLGPWYHSSTTGVNQGSRTAGAATLYHHTVKTDQTKDGAPTVDIGFHYVALNGSGWPVDTDSDGVPDYLEDANGNGALDSGETQFNNASDLGFKVWITEPKPNSNLP